MASVEQAWQREDFASVRAGLAYLVQTTGTPLAHYRYAWVLIEGLGGPVDIPTALPLLEQAVAKDHLQAHVLLGRLLLSGDNGGPARDPVRAAELLTSAATRGEDEAQYYLALLYQAGDGVPQNAKRAVDWLRASAEQDHTAAQYELARALATGTGIAPDAAQSAAWLTRAATRGHIAAQLALSRAYETGSGVPQDAGAALDWLRQAAEAGSPLAQRNLGMAYVQGTGTAVDVPKGVQWLEQAAQAGEAGAMNNLGFLYATGTGVTQDEARAVVWYDRAVDAGLGRAMLTLGVMREAGRGGPRDIPEAIALYQRALGTDSRALAAARLGRLAVTHRAAFGTDTSARDLVDWVFAAARAGAPEAEVWLDQRRTEGMSVATLALALLYLEDETRTEAGLALLSEAALQGEPGAQVRLGKRHMTGDGVALDYVQAHKWFNIAATLGASDAPDLRSTVAALMSGEDVAAAQSAARLWFETEQPQPPRATDP